MAPAAQAEAEVRKGVLDLPDVDVQPLRELGRELVARLRADLLEGGVELGRRDAERGRELPADVVAAVSPVVAVAAVRAQILQRGADLRGVEAGGGGDVSDDRVEVAPEAANLGGYLTGGSTNPRRTSRSQPRCLP